MGVRVALVGRNSRCKTLFLKAASSDTAVSDTTLETEASWTSTLTPKQTDLAQVPEHGFSPFGERLLSTRLSHMSAAEIFGRESKHSGEDYSSCDAMLLVVPADVAFHKGRPRPSRGGVNPVKAAADRLRERFEGRHVPFAVAVCVDFENGAEFGLATMTSVKAFLSSVKNEMALEGVPVVEVTPRTELWLREQEQEGGRVSYRRGDTQFRVSCHRLCC